MLLVFFQYSKNSWDIVECLKAILKIDSEIISRTFGYRS